MPCPEIKTENNEFHNSQCLFGEAKIVHTRYTRNCLHTAILKASEFELIRSISGSKNPWSEDWPNEGEQILHNWRLCIETKTGDYG